MRGIEGIIVHDIHTSAPIFINISAIKAVKEINGVEREYSVIFVGQDGFSVKETFGEIMLEIRETESEDKT